MINLRCKNPETPYVSNGSTGNKTAWRVMSVLHLIATIVGHGTMLFGAKALIRKRGLVHEFVIQPAKESATAINRSIYDI
jgi:hypothetical protein